MKRPNRWTLKSLFLLAVISFAATSCRSVVQPVISYTPEIARAVSQVSSEIATGGAIRVRFSSPVSDRARSLGADVVSFSPRFRYDLTWEDARTLAATPLRRLAPGSLYRATVDLGSLVDSSLPPLQFEFLAIGTQLLVEEVSLEATDDDSFVVVGKLVFSVDVEMSLLERALSLRDGRKSRRIEIAPASGSGGGYSFRSEPLVRGSREREVEMLLDSEAMEMERSIHRSFIIPASEDFSVVSVESVDGDVRSGFRIQLSDALDDRQRLEGLISVTPSAHESLRSAGREVYLLGEFNPGQTYAIEVSSHVRSDDGRETGEDQRFDVVVPHLEPQVEFLSDGVFLPSANQNTLGIRTLNIRGVRLRVERVFENNIGQFLQTESLESGVRRTSYFDYTYLNRVGIEIAQQRLEIGEAANEWIVSGIDLSEMFTGQPKGLYVVTLQYDEADIIASPPEYYYRYWENSIFKPVVATDIGITYKRVFDEHIVYLTNLIDARPMRAVSVELRSYQHQLIAQGTTDEEGFISFPSAPGSVFYVIAEDRSQRAVIKLNEMGWNLSSFDTGGVEVAEDGMRAFTYTERGVYRPGDPIHLSIILRNSDSSFPDGHPISVDWYNPRGQLIAEYETNEGVDGFYTVELSTSESDPTGEWQAAVEAGGNRFFQPVSVETVVPFTLKVEVKPEQERLSHLDRELAFEIDARYLFGTPASGLSAEATLTLNHVVREFDRFRGFVFDDEAMDFASIPTVVFRGPLDDEGRAEVSWRLPTLGKIPSGLDVDVSVRVFERGGRPNTGSVTIPLEPYDRYVGLRKPDMPYGYARMGSDVSIGYVLTDLAGEAAPGHSLTYRIYKNESYWWWEYDNRQEFRLHYKTDSNTTLVDEGSVVSASNPGSFSVRPEEWGEYYVELTDDSLPGHTAGFFFRSSWWGASPTGSDEASLLALRTDSERYSVGDMATVTFPSPAEGRVLLSLERGGEILESRFFDLTGESETSVTIPITPAMVPNVYVSLSVLQPHAQSVNDRPLRLYGVVDLPVEDPATKRGVEIVTAEEFEPNKRFTIEMATTDGSATQFTVAVVDEGLLDLTGFATPDPWMSFYRKQRLGVSTYDTFSHVIGANDGDFFRLFSIGGGYDQGLFAGADDGEKRFEPVSLFAGPISTDTDGRATVEFEMPNYIGSVRVMVVAADGAAYGFADKAVPVTKELIVLPSFPRVLGPDEEFEVPVTVFGLADALGRVTVSLDVDGSAVVDGESVQVVNFEESGERNVTFRVRTLPEVGRAHFALRAVAIGANASNETAIQVRASSPRIGTREDATVDRGSSIRLDVPDDGLPGTNFATISIASQPDLDIDHRIRWLVRYPYGCIEQTTSAVFPQLFLDSLIEGTIPGQEIDTNINAGIERLRSFQLASGGFSYWPGSSNPSSWGTNYAGHFLIEADRLGYYVPAAMLAGWVRFQTSRALSASDGLMERVYRVYLLALAGEPSLSAMNLLLEESFDEMTDTMRWLLANAYVLRGMEEVAASILARTGREVGAYKNYGSTYGSALRDEAMILESMVRFGRWSEAQELFRSIARRMSSEAWYSTQTTSYSLLAMGKLIGSRRSGVSAEKLIGSVSLPDGSVSRFDTEEVRLNIPVTEGFGGEAVVTLDAESSFERAFVTIDWEGIPLRSGNRAVTRNLTVAVTWYDDTGRPMNPARLTQGTSFWGVFRVGKTEDIALTELALVQIVPSGWEIENLRLSGESFPEFLNGRGINNAEYTDIRDDRILWFFDMPQRERSREFAVKLNAVTKGQFYLPQVTFEAMYDDDFYASRPGRSVQVR